MIAGERPTPTSTKMNEFEKINKEFEPRRQEWLKKFTRTFGPPSPELPPLHEVNHYILLLNPDVRYSVRPPRCSAALFPLLRKKTQRYINAGWWTLSHGRNAIPLLCIPKHSMEVMVYQYDKLFGYGWLMTSILTITHILIFLGYSEFPSWLPWQPIQILRYPKSIQQNIPI